VLAQHLGFTSYLKLLTGGGFVKKDTRFVLGVDLDGVVADFYGGLRPIAAEWLGVSVEELPAEVSYGLPEWKLKKAGGYESLHRFAVTQRDLFRNLEPIPGAPAVLRQLSASQVRIRIITHRLFIKFFHLEAIRQTTEWLDHHGIPYWDICFMRDKAAVGANLYVEDSPTNVEQLRADKHPTIVFTNSTNRSLPGPRADNWDEVEKLVRKEIKQWKTKKASQRKRLSGE
jgi:5'(3')-deoxyribonucleotidase